MPIRIPLLIFLIVFPVVYFQTSAHYTFIKLCIFYVLAALGLLCISLSQPFVFKRQSNHLLVTMLGMACCWLGHAGDSDRIVNASFVLLWIFTLSQISPGYKARRLLVVAISVGAIGVMALSYAISPLSGNSRLMFPLGNPNVLAAYLTLPVCVAVWQAIKSYPQASGWSLGFASLAMIAIFTIVKTESSGGVLALGVAGVALASYAKNPRWGLCVGAILGGGLLGASLAMKGGTEGFAVWFQSSFPVRHEGIVAGIRMWQTSPWFGHGEGTFFNLLPTYASEGIHLSDGFGSYSAAAHNEYIEVLVGHGVVGLIIFLALLLAPIIYFCLTPRRNVAPFLGVHCGWLVFMAFSVGMRYHVFQLLFWTNYGLLLAFMHPARRVHVSMAKPLRYVAILCAALFCLFAVHHAWKAFQAEQNFLQARLALRAGDAKKALSLAEAAKRDHIDFRRRVLIDMLRLNAYGKHEDVDKQLVMIGSLESQVPAFQNIRKRQAFLTYTHKSKEDGLVLMLKELKRDRFYFIPRDFVITLLGDLSSLDFLTDNFQRSDVICIEAMQLMGQKKFQQALAGLNTLSLEDNTIAHITMLKAICYKALGQFKEAIELYQAHKERYPFSAEGYRGIVLTLEAQFAALPKEGQAAQASTVSSAIAHELAQWVNARNERFNPDVAREQVRLLIRYRQWQGAYTKLRDMAEVGDKNLANALNLTKVCLELKRPEEAKAVLQKAMRKYTDPTDAQRKRGQALAQRIEESLRGQ